MPRKSGKTPKSGESSESIPSLGVCQFDDCAEAEKCEKLACESGTCTTQSDQIKEIDFQEGSVKKSNPEPVKSIEVKNVDLESLRLHIADLEMKISDLQTKVDNADKVDSPSKAVDAQICQPTVVDDSKFDQMVATAVATAVAEAIQQERAWVNSQILLKLAQARR